MTLAVAAVFALGVLLVASPFLWPARQRVAAATPSMVSAFRDRMSAAGLRSTSVPLFVAVSAFVGVVTAALVFAFVPVGALAVASGLAAVVAPVLVVNWRARQRLRAARAQWPDAVDHLLSGVRAGLSLPDSLAALARVGPAGSRAAIAEFERDYAATGNFSACVDRLKEALADPVADRILETLRMSREVGGSELPGVLRSLSSFLREEAAVRGEVEARQSWVVNAARLGAAAPWVVLALLSTRPEAAAAYNTAGGVVLIVGGLVVTFVAYRLMLAIARLPEERRWFA
ncbi:MAG TPA: type II secretion system F family protein [Terrimesophilobacter sp.]|nr:type II secretion system F family protein [Terrimesophilobacter sp.]